MAAEELRLTPLMSRFVGGRRGLSRAESRRLMVACELALDPDVLLVDELTSQLPGNDVTNLVKALLQVREQYINCKTQIATELFLTSGILIGMCTGLSGQSFFQLIFVYCDAEVCLFVASS